MLEKIQVLLKRRLKKYRKIATVKTPKYMEEVLDNNISCVFLLMGNLGVIKRYVEFYRKHNIPVFLHIDKIGGLSSNSDGIEFVANYIKPAGIISTRNSLLRIAKKNGLLTIQRLFLVDSDAVKKGLKEIENHEPDYLELMPALVPELIQRVNRISKIPVITGGLVGSPKHMYEALNAGAVAVSASNPVLWKVDLTQE